MSALSEKVARLAAGAQFDICTAGDLPVTGAPPLIGSITRLARPGGGCLSVLKVLLTDACHLDCCYCANRSERRFGRSSLKPEELCDTFIGMRERGLVDGIFLSSAIHGSAAESMADLVTTAEILRRRHCFRGYVHLKVLPGSPRDCIERAVELADRVSVNMEAPTQSTMDRLAPKKGLAEDVIKRMQWIKQAAERAGAGTLKAGQTTQFVVGAAGESDRAIMSSVEALRRSVALRRAYFSAFLPIQDTPLEGERPCSPQRQHRLYQADWLLREYRFTLGELVFGADGDLPTCVDPKLAHALGNLHLFPLEVNQASLPQLLHVPGIGPVTAERLISARRQGPFISFDELRNLGTMARATPFLLVAGRRQGRISDVLRAGRVAQDQLELFLPGEAVSVVLSR